ncbi:hypothetical protein BROUX41_006037 [Berkeleyomyces rouxiae]
MSQVKNLRAMFESKGDSGSPDRGRSPVLALPLTSESPRPLSKIRTNFIAVEKDGRIGLQRESSIESTKTSTSSSAAPPPAAIAAPTTPVLDKQPEPKKIATPQQKPEPAKASEPTVSKPPAAVDKQSSPPPILVKDTTAAEGHKPGPAPKQASSKKENPKNAKQATAKHAAAKETSAKPSKEGANLTVKTSSTSAAKTSKSPTVLNPPKKSAVREAREPVKRTAAHPPRSKTPAPKTQPPAQSQSAPSQSRKPPSAHAKHSSRPAPASRSPTRQTTTSKLVAEPASSISRTGKASFSDLRTAARSSATKTDERSASRARSVAPTLRRLPSSLDVKNQRPSLGLPPKKKDSSVRQPPKDVDEGFLARMMRPTQSSQSKVTEKAPVTPPRKNNTTPRRPATRSGTRRDRSTPSAQRVPRPLSRMASPACLNRTPPIVSPTFKIDDLSSGPTTGPIDYPEVEKMTVELKATVISDSEPSPVSTSESNQNDCAHAHGGSDGAVSDADIPKTPEALPSLEASTVTPHEAMEPLHSQEPIEHLLDSTTAALQDVKTNLGLEKQESTAADGDVFGVPTKPIELQDFETY